MALAEPESIRLQETGEVNPLDEIIDGVIAALELERSLGVRVVEFDRTLLNTPALAQANPTPEKVMRRVSAPPPRQAQEEQHTTEDTKPILDLVFLHEKALSEKAIEMMAKIINALGKTAQTAPIIITGEKPKAKVYVVLGSRALRMWYPETTAYSGAWFNDNNSQVLVTYSPEYILRFSSGSPELDKIKKTMWRDLKIAAARGKQERTPTKS